MYMFYTTLVRKFVDLLENLHLKLYRFVQNWTAAFSLKFSQLFTFSTEKNSCNQIKRPLFNERRQSCFMYNIPVSLFADEGESPSSPLKMVIPSLVQN